ncbi:hypothetical protein ACFLT4_01540 [Chloroflexota bacterium]
MDTLIRLLINSIPLLFFGLLIYIIIRRGSKGSTESINKATESSNRSIESYDRLTEAINRLTDVIEKK